MMTDSLRVSVVAAPLAAIDPRALSQAWYSALHLARRRGNGSPRVRRAEARSQAQTAPQPPRSANVQTQNALSVSHVRRMAPARASTGESTVRRVQSGFARRLATALTRRSGIVKRATFVVADGSKRALIVLQTRGNATHVVAICAPAQREAVARALLQARASLCARGIALHSRVETNAACS
jgi:hypothetical protein